MQVITGVRPFVMMRVRLSDINQILEAWKSFYSKLFQADPPDLEAQGDVLNHLTMFLSSDQMHLCEGPITVEEALVALKGMARRKTPGSDGLSAEFFLKFWNVLGSDLVQVLNTSHEYGTLPSSMRKSLITLLFKKGDRLDMKNWRPISLLNIDYKLCARDLAGRLLKVIHLVVHRDQSCSVPGRYIGDVSFLHDIIDISSELFIPAAILSIDQEKAFDRVDWSFLILVLEKMGFGPSFISWIRLLYYNIRCSVLVNGYASLVLFPTRCQTGLSPFSTSVRLYN